MLAQISGRLPLILPLLAPSAGGLVYLYAFDAPGRLLVINAGALAAALVWIVLGRLPASEVVRRAIAVPAALGLFVPLLLGPDVGDVSRWLPAGPVMLHSGALLLPLLIVLSARERTIGPAILTLAGAALALQPDAAMLAGLGGASAVLAWLHRSAAFAIVAAAGLILAAVTFGDGALAPQIYTEHVLTHVAERSPAQAFVLAILLFAVPSLLLVLGPQTRREEGYALAALLLGLSITAALAPFPYPLIGYGASPILGFGLALGAIVRGGYFKAGQDDRFVATC